ncbi:ribosome biogenesis GTPase YqeH [Paenibacillus sp. J31TS4]|uniref:ribosome biogenesis GTPase YqeH n=1 Tax=Paenibacillus sp. J31TS4 TaxID=2807195 RepID=UPI001B0678DD|nr:ribosome biogenesis GTPase YqeH [Paenibacillus sp. J31TS4]GIP39549.1 ribosome biogenesis GTPase YqeH [Paenibacillus sp. J31TS4]
MKETDLQNWTEEEDLRCEGCGVKLQLDDPSRLGYIPEQALAKVPVVCQRCFRIKHYNDVSSATIDQNEFLRMLGHIANTKSLVVHIVDLFDFEGSLIGGLQRFVGNNPVLLVVNKIDLLPKVSNMNRILNWVQKQAKEHGVKTEDIVLVSAKKKIGFDRLLAKLEEHRRGRDVYVVGATNAGKSTLINRLIKDYSDLEAELTTSQYPGTTLDLVRIPLDDGKAIIDTPGIVYKHRLTELVPKNVLQALLPDKPLKPLVFQLNERQTLFFGALARFDFVKGEHQSFTCFVSSDIKVHRTKLEKAEELYENHRGELLYPPGKEEADSMPAWTKFPVRVPKGAKMDVVISGLGWIKVNSDLGAELEVHAPKGVKIALRPSLI